MRRAIVSLPLDLLATLIQLPTGVELERTLPSDGNRVVRVVLSGDGLPEECATPGWPIPSRIRYEDQHGQVLTFIEPLA